MASPLPQIVFLTLATTAGLIAQPTPAPLPHFEKDVLAYEAAEKANPPPPGAILLVGDSQFFRWKTFREDLAGYTVINRGIDSFQLSDLNHFFDRLVRSHQARLIVLHVGGNDVHSGKTAAEILADFKTFVGLVRANQPNVPIAFTSTTPSPGRWTEADRRRETNQLIKDYIKTQPKLLYIDLWDAFLGPDGQPRADLYGPDQIHPNHAGYLVRVKIMRPILGPPDH